VSFPTHLRMVTEPVSENSCFLFSTIPDDGKSPDTILVVFAVPIFFFFLMVLPGQITEVSLYYNLMKDSVP
jgi:hypothetical protein